MPSVRSLSGFALGAAQVVLADMTSPIYRNLLSRSAVSCPSGGALSCHNTTAQSNLCCFNAPGGALLQTQFWDTNPQTGPVDSWTIHGLWPDNCDGTYQANCDSSRAYTNITQILQAAGQQDLLNYMNTYWPDYQGNNENFWEHEWGKHGTCISTLDPECYTNYQPTDEVPDFFNRVVSLFKTLPSYQWLSDAGIVPSSSQTYALSDIKNALAKNRGGHIPYVGCSNGALDEIWYFYNVQGSVQSGTFSASDIVGSSGSCPSSGIKYLPKTSSGSPTSTATTTATTATSTATSSPGSGFSGSGTLNVISGGSAAGYIISGGTWYSSNGTPATFTASASGSGFTLKTSKGLCAISSGALTCSSSVSTGTVFSSSGNNLVYNGQQNFYADGTPSGSQQNTVYTSSSHSTSLTIQWKSK